MPNPNNSDVSAQDIEYLKTCGILAPSRWLETPQQTQAESAYAESVALMNYLQAIQNRSLDKPQAGPML